MNLAIEINDPKFEKLLQKDLTANLQIDKIWIAKDNTFTAKYDTLPNGVLGIEWHGAAGFGRYELILQDDGLLHAHTEHMGKKEDKAFTKAILAALIDKIVIEE